MHWCINTFVHYFNSDLLAPLEKSQVAYWDETHRMCDLTDSTSQPPRGKNYVYRVRRDENGVIDPEGSFQNTDPTKLKVKYEEEIRLDLGVFCMSIQMVTLKIEELLPSLTLSKQY